MYDYLDRLKVLEEALAFGEITEDDLKAHKLAHSKKFDVHTWSDHPEVNAFINPIYDKYFKGREEETRKRHVKVLLLDLYVTWCQDSNLYVSYSRNKGAYKAKSRYNELHISRTTISLVDALVEAGLIEQNLGFYNREYNFGKESRIAPTPKLIEMFKNVRFSIFDVDNHSDRLTVILRDKDIGDKKPRDIEYEPIKETEQISKFLKSYNALLRKSYIDIPQLGDNGRFVGEENLLSEYSIRHTDKFVTRIFNRGSFEYGGRFFGGWWQQCPKEFRPYIFINDQPTNEIDFSGLHIVMIYALEGINYWNEDGDDPYKIEIQNFEETYEGHLRAIAKNLLLVLLNAKSSKKAYAAFRKNAGKNTLEGAYKDDFLKCVHKALSDRHPKIKNYFGNDSGIKLMRLDSDISQLVLKRFLEFDIPVLCLHDSYIVPVHYEDELIDIMHDAFESIMGVKLGNREKKAIKEQAARAENLEAVLDTWMPYENLDYQIIDEKNYLKRLFPTRSERYKREHKLFREWLAANNK